MAAIAGKILNAEGVWISPTGDVTLFFALLNFPVARGAWLSAATPGVRQMTAS